MEEKIMLAAVALLALEDTGVRVAARGGAYGASSLVLVDTATNEEHSLEDVLTTAGKAGYDVSTYEG